MNDTVLHTSDHLSIQHDKQLLWISQLPTKWPLSPAMQSMTESFAAAQVCSGEASFWLTLLLYLLYDPSQSSSASRHSYINIHVHCLHFSIAVGRAKHLWLCHFLSHWGPAQFSLRFLDIFNEQFRKIQASTSFGPPGHNYFQHLIMLVLVRRLYRLASCLWMQMKGILSTSLRHALSFTPIVCWRGAIML